MSDQQTSKPQPVAVVTGANSGIGRATAIYLAQQGFRVFGTVRSLDKAAKLVALAEKLGVAIELVEMQQMIYLRYTGGLTTKEIARTMGKSEVATRVGLSRATVRLREVLQSGQEGIEL